MKRIRPLLGLVGLLITCVVLSSSVKSGVKKSVLARAEFTRTSIDFGIVVRDIQKSVEFYTKGLGFSEIQGFDVPPDVGRDSGLADNYPFHVHVLVLGQDKDATRVKLMQFKGVSSKAVDHDFIHSSLGMSYTTIWVKDITSAVARAEKYGAKPRAKGPIALPGDLYLAVVDDPDGNIVELVGPKN